MVGRRGRPPKRKVEELQEDLDGKSKSAKEAKIEAISLDGSEPVHIALLTLNSETWRNQESSEDWNEDHSSRVSEAEEGRKGTLSQGTCWRGIPDPPPSQVSLSCTRVPSGEAFDCETQTFHFTPVSASKVVVVPDSDTPETIKVEIDTDQQEEFLNHPLVCCVEGCEAHSDTDTVSTFYTVPQGKEKSIWAETLGIKSCEGEGRQHVCSKHFITPTKLLNQKGRTRKKKTCDMLVAEEAEKIRQGLSSGRPKRTPKPNKNYDWAEIVPLIKSEPDEFEESLMESGDTLDKTGGAVVNPRKQFLSFLKEDKENKKPTSDTEVDAGGDDEEEEEEEEDLENISLPSHPRPPPPKPKGRPHRIRDSGTQTEAAYKLPGPRLPLREVKVQCNLNTEPPSPCTSCSYLNWLRLEELLVDCATKIEGNLCVPEVQECLRKVVGSVPHPTHATNVLKLLSGDERDALENTSDIILVANEEDDVEIENVIHTAVEEPVTGLREIIPKTWQKKTKWKKPLAAVEVVSKEEEEEDLDGLGIQEATEMDDEEFHPGYLEGEETEEEDDQGLDDEDWTINKQDRDSRPGGKKKQRKQQQTKIKKDPDDGQESGGEVCCRHCRRGFVNFRTFDAHRCRGRPSSIRSSPSERRFPCNQCGKTFTQKISLQYHNIYVHNGERKAACPHCDYRAPDKAKLSVHLRTHSKLRPFVCELCRASFKFRSTYRSHVARHTNSGNYVCSQCNKAFTMASELREHRRIHGQERPFVCPLCAMTFKQKKQLRVHHRAVHLRDKRYVCEVCGSCHINNWNLRAHMKTHIRTDTTYANFCKHCGSIFRGRAGLAAHMRLRHSTEYNQQNPPPPEEWGEEEEEEEEEDELQGKYQVVLGLPASEAIEHVVEPQQKQEVKMIEVYSCSCCGQLCESLEQLRAHSFNEH